MQNFEQVFREFNHEASASLIEKLLQQRDINQTFDITADNFSFLNESKLTWDKQLEIEALHGKSHIISSKLPPLDKQKIAKFLDPKLHSYFKKFVVKINMKGTRLNTQMWSMCSEDI